MDEHKGELKRPLRVNETSSFTTKLSAQQYVYNGMRRECKCHGLSGACSMQTCWLRLAPFREVATKLRDGWRKWSVRVTYIAYKPSNRPKSLTSASVKKSNKKRSSASPSSSSGTISRQSSLNGLSRSSASSLVTNSQYYNPFGSSSSNSLTSDTFDIVGSGRRGFKRHTANADDCEDCHRLPVAGAIKVQSNNDIHDDQMTRSPSSREQIIGSLGRNASSSSSMVAPQRRPRARPIGITAASITPSKYDHLYYEDSPDFCVPSESYNIRGTKGRTCSERPEDQNSCEKLCCGRGYKTEVKEEKVKCECQLKFCCELICNTCSRRKVTHKCL